MKKIVIVSGLTFIFFFVTDRAFFFNQGVWESIGSTLTYPFVRISSALSSTTQHITAEKREYDYIKERYDAIQKEYLYMVDEVVKLRATQHTYDNLKELIEFKNRYNLPNKIIATIIVKNIAPDEHYYLINKGSRDGVTKDMVALYQNHLVGRVCDVYYHYSKVKLITDQYCKVSAYDAQTNSSGFVQGFNCINRCKFTYVSHLVTVNDHDVVLTSGQGLVFPEGFCIGRIVTNTLKEKELYHFIEVEPFINLQTIESCMLIDYASVQSLKI